MCDIIGERIKDIRTTRGLTLRKLAATAAVPLSTLSAVETGKRPGNGLTLATARKIARALSITLDHLAFDDDVASPSRTS
jgi:Predicted transcriptional regulators